MRQFFRGGRELPFGKGERVNMLTSYQDRSGRPKERNNIYNRLLLPLGRSRSDGTTGEDMGSFRSAQNLPLFCLCSTKTGSIPNGSPMNPRSLSGFDRESIGSSSGKGSILLGLGRLLFGVRRKRSLGEENEGNEVRSSVFLRSFFGRHLTAALPPPYRGLTATLPLVRLRYDFSKAGVNRREEGAHTWAILRAYTESASARVAGWFGMASRVGRTTVQTCSTVVRVLFGCCSSASRSPLEDESNSTRRCLEEFSNTSRSAVEAEGAEAPERYCKGTGKVLNSGGKGTEEVLESYQRGTKDLHVDGKSAVALEKSISKLGNGGNAVYLVLGGFKRSCRVQIVKDVSLGGKRKRRVLGSLNKAVRHCGRNEMERSNLLSRLLRQASRSKFGTQRSDGSVWLSACLMIFCVLFSVATVSPVFGQEADGLKLKPQRITWKYNYSLYDAVTFKPYNHERYYRDALKEYPKVDLEKFEIGSHVIDTLKIKQIKVGDKIPDELLDLPLWIVNDYNGRDTITLRQECDKEWLIIDLWADFCGPCVKSMNAWEKRYTVAEANFTLLGNFNTNFTYKAMPSCRRFGFKSTQIIGKSAALIHYLFLRNDRRLGPTLWIRDGRLFGISFAGKLSETEYQDILSGKLPEIPSHAAYVYGSYR